ncbi:MAG: sugar transferase [Bacteroidetes bacterium]|nr:sugar transferase [Bacteroidota bacterium]
MTLRNFSSKAPYLLADFLLSATCWLLAWLLRREWLSNDPNTLPNLYIWLRALMAGVAWVLLYNAFGLYRDTYRYSRIRELGLVLEASILGVFIIAFLSFINDPEGNYRYIQRVIFIYLGIQFIVIGLNRLLISSWFKWRLQQGRLRQKSILIGNGPAARQYLNTLPRFQYGASYEVVGHIALENREAVHLPLTVPCLGQLSHMYEIIRQYKIRYVLLALEPEEYPQYFHLLKALQDAPVRLVAAPQMYDFLLGKAHMLTEMVYAPIEIDTTFQRPFTAFLKRSIDIGVSLTALILLLPVFTILAILVGSTSRGPVFFRQERIGKNGKPFRIIKFRSMYIDAEKHGPALSQHNDPRITPVGRFLRKTRLDELPQFWNVLMGDMSLVGPRPERQYWIDQIVPHAPEYLQLLCIKPGITSLGQVRFGYASNVEEMLQRLRYDLLYLEHMSLSWDFRILFYTVQIVFQGRGK